MVIPIQQANDIKPRRFLRVLCYGYREGMLAFAQTWPGPMTVSIGEGLRKAHNAALEALEPIIEQLVLRNPSFQTLVLDIDGHPQGKATGPHWSDEHCRFFFALFDRWSDRHIVILANEDRIANAADSAVDRRPDVPPMVEDACDVILHYDAAEATDPLKPPMQARCEKHRPVPILAGVTLRWTAEAVLDASIEGGPS